MKLTPVITEKSTSLAKSGKYTFRVDKNLTKIDIKNLISKIFGVKVLGVHTIKERGEIKRAFSGRRKIVKPSKKAIVTLSEKDKIDLFETEKSKKKK